MRVNWANKENAWPWTWGIARAVNGVAIILSSHDA